MDETNEHHKQQQTRPNPYDTVDWDNFWHCGHTADNLNCPYKRGGGYCKASTWAYRACEDQVSAWEWEKCNAQG